MPSSSKQREKSVRVARPPVLCFRTSSCNVATRNSTLVQSYRARNYLGDIDVIPGNSLRRTITTLHPSKLGLTIRLGLIRNGTLSPTTRVPLLIQPSNDFYGSFAKLLHLSLAPQHETFTTRLCQRLRHRLLTCTTLFPTKAPLHVSDRRRARVVPLIFQALLRILTSRRLPIRRLHVPTRPLSPFINYPQL